MPADIAGVARFLGEERRRPAEDVRPQHVSTPSSTRSLRTSSSRKVKIRCGLKRSLPASGPPLSASAASSFARRAVGGVLRHDPQRRHVTVAFVGVDLRRGQQFSIAPPSLAVLWRKVYRRSPAAANAAGPTVRRVLAATGRMRAPPWRRVLCGPDLAVWRDLRFRHARLCAEAQGGRFPSARAHPISGRGGQRREYPHRHCRRRPQHPHLGRHRP